MPNNKSVELFKRQMQAIPAVAARELDDALRAEADRLADDMRSAVPIGPTGNLHKSIRVEKGRRPLSYAVRAGGPLTTKQIGTRTYEREVKIGSGDTAGIARQAGGAGVTYDYALAVELGTVKEPAHPFFWPTYRRDKSSIKASLARAARVGINRVAPVR